MGDHRPRRAGVRDRCSSPRPSATRSPRTPHRTSTSRTRSTCSTCCSRCSASQWRGSFSRSVASRSSGRSPACAIVGVYLIVFPQNPLAPVLVGAARSAARRPPDSRRRDASGRPAPSSDATACPMSRSSRPPRCASRWRCLCCCILMLTSVGGGISATSRCTRFRASSGSRSSPDCWRCCCTTEPSRARRRRWPRSPSWVTRAPCFSCSRSRPRWASACPCHGIEIVGAVLLIAVVTTLNLLQASRRRRDADTRPTRSLAAEAGPRPPSFWIVVLIKDFTTAKGRLASGLDARATPAPRRDDRRARARRRTRRCPDARGVWFGGGRRSRPRSAAPRSLSSRRRAARTRRRCGASPRSRDRGAEAALLLSSDLPLVDEAAIRRMLAAPRFRGAPGGRGCGRRPSGHQRALSSTAR